MQVQHLTKLETPNVTHEVDCLQLETLTIHFRKRACMFLDDLQLFRVTKCSLLEEKQVVRDVKIFYDHFGISKRLRTCLPFLSLFCYYGDFGN